MPYNYRIIFLSLSIVSRSLAAENPSININPLNKSNAPEIIHNFINNQQQETTKPISQPLAFSALELKEMLLVFARSPQAAQCIVNHLQDPSYFPLNENYRSAIFVGEPGTGKTATAKAIAHKMAEKDWEYKFIPSTSLLGEHRNQTAIRLQKELEAIEASKKPTILIIDELNLLMENSESKNHDTDATAKALWTFLDQQKDNKDFFFIGTMNRANKLPQAYKSRILFDYIKFPLINDIKLKTEFIRTTLTTQTTKLGTEVTNEFLNKELEKMGSCSGRDLKNISSAICRTSKMNAPTSPSPMEIKQAAIITAIDQYVKNKIELNYDIQEETDEERQNRHHKETIELQRIHHEEQKLLHKENQQMQEMHFIQQQTIQACISENNYVRTDHDGTQGLSINRYFKSDGTGRNYSLISDEQKKLYDNIMKKTREREAAVEKAAAEEAAKWPWDRK